MKTLILPLMILAASPVLAGVNLDLSGAFPQAVICEENQNLMVFNFQTEPDTTIKATDLAFLSPVNLVLMDGSPVSGIRLEVCMDSDFRTATFKRIIKRVPSIGAWLSFRYDEIVDDTKVPNPGLSAALFHDVSSLHMEFPNSKDPKKSFLLKGHVTKDGRQIITLSYYNSKSKAPLKPTNEYVFAGMFLEGDPFIPRGTRSHRTLDVGGIQISYDLMYTGSRGNYLSYKFRSFTIVDSRSGFKYEGGSDDAHLKIQYTHHGLSDGFNFVFPEAEYRLTPTKLQVITNTPPNVVEFNHNCSEVHVCGEPIQ